MESMHKALTLLALALFASFCFATTIVVLTPIQKQIADYQEVNLGTIGPGQTVSLSVEPKVTTGGVNGIGGRWDTLVITRPPLGWTVKASKWDADPLQVELTAPADAPEGNYTALVTIADDNDAEKIGGSMTFRATVTISNDVMAMDVAPREVKVGANQPARFLITIENKGDASDVFEVSSSGIRGWDFRKTIYVGSKQTKQLSYEAVGKEEQTLHAQIKARSVSSDLIQKNQNVTIKVETDLISDYKATTRGLMVFPMIEQPVYSLMGLIGNLFN